MQLTWGAPTEKIHWVLLVVIHWNSFIALDSSGPSVQAPDATSMQAPGATSVKAQLLFREEGLMTGSKGTSGSAPVWSSVVLDKISSQLLLKILKLSCHLH
jgi:hypothetical protein